MTNAQMKPGRELDALVAEKVMGWRDARLHRNGPTDPCEWEAWQGIPPEPEHGWRTALPHYSTSIADAWQVVEWLAEHHDGFVSVGVRSVDWGESGDYYDHFAHTTSGESAPHAICLAALAAVGSPE